MNEAALLSLAAALDGRRLGGLAADLGVPLPPDPRRHKGWVGQLVEKALGATAGSAAAPDFGELGIELKTLPVDATGRPTESTFVSSLDLSDPWSLDWERSSVRHKLARVLWVPIETDRAVPFPERRLGAARLWVPSADEELLLRADFELIAELVQEGFLERITARTGRFLQLRPKGADRHQRRWSYDPDGEAVRTAPRAFYLRRTFTEVLVRRYWVA